MCHEVQLECYKHPNIFFQEQITVYNIICYMLYVLSCSSFNFHLPPPSLAMSSEESDSDDTDPYVEEERYLEANEFMEHPDFGKDSIRQRKLLSAAIRQRVREQSEAHLNITPDEKPVDTIKSNETNDKRLSYLAIFVASLITLCVLRFVLKEPCNCTCTINI